MGQVWGECVFIPISVGRGDTDWPHLLANLDGAGYEGWLTIDPVDLPERREASIAGLAYLRGLEG